MSALPRDRDLEASIQAGIEHRQGRRRARGQLAALVSVAIVVVWTVYVSLDQQWGRVGDNWEAAATMIGGSFVAGSTPQGGGAVAFPVFTKGLEVPAEVARSFSLCIQAVGMGTAALAIWINRRRVAWSSVAIALPAALVGLAIGLFALGDPGEPFWPSRLPGPYVKVTFTLVVAAMAAVVYMGYRRQILERRADLPELSRRLVATLIVAGVVGGIATALVGSGADVFLYLVLVVLAALSPRVGVPSSVVVMAGVSLAGLIVLGLLDGQLMTQLGDGGEVVAVGGQSVTESAGQAVYGSGEGLPAGQFDLFGLWLAAVPVAAVGAPLGALAAARLSDRQLVVFVTLLAGAEVVTTLIFVDELRGDFALAVYAVVGATLLIGALLLATRWRRELLGIPGAPIDDSLTRSRLDVGPRYREDLAPDDDDGGNE